MKPAVLLALVLLAVLWRRRQPVAAPDPRDGPVEWQW